MIKNGHPKNTFSQVYLRQLEDVSQDPRIAEMPKMKNLCVLGRKKYTTVLKGSSRFQIGRYMVMVVNNHCFHQEENKKEQKWSHLKSSIFNFQKEFFHAKEDAVKMKNMIEDETKKNYVHIVVFESLWRHQGDNDPKEIYIHPFHMNICSSCSFHFSEENGANIDWIMTNPFHCEKLNNRDEYIRGLGVAKFLLLMVQDFLRVQSMNLDLYLETTTKFRYPYLMYRNLFFTHVNSVVPVPVEFQKLHESHQDLHLLKSTLPLCEVLKFDEDKYFSESQEINWEYIFTNAYKILQPAEVPKAKNSFGLTEQELSAVQELLKRPEVTHPIYPGVYIQDQDPAGVEYEYDEENCSTCPGNEKTTEIMYNLHHDFAKEETQIARCEFPGHGMACMWTVDESNQESQGLQDMGEESSSCYMSLSQLLYGDKRYYDRIRLAIAWVYSELLKVENHPHMTVNELFTSKRLEKFEEANLIKAVVDPSFQSKEQFIKGDRTIKQHPNPLLKHRNICVVQLQFALEKTVDISDFGLEIFCSIFACNIHILQSFSRQEKVMCMDRKTKNYGRFWYGKLKQKCLENETFVTKYGGNLHLSRKLLKKTWCCFNFRG